MSELYPVRDKWLAAIVLLSALGFYAYSVLDVMTHARTWVDEVTYLTKSWTYVSGSVAAYSDLDSTWYMPLHFYELWYWQKLFETDMWQSRLLSAILGALNSLLIVDIVRRITGNLIAGTLAAAVFLSVPAVTFYFGAATPIATVSLLLLITIWLVIAGLGRESVWRSLCLGILFSVLYFYRQNMILVILALAPLYLISLRQSRLAHSVLVFIGMVVVAAPLLYYFPERLISYAMRLPVITPILTDLGLIEDPLLFIEANTVADIGLGLALTKIAWPDIVDALVLPYAGLIMMAVSVFFFATGKLRILTLAPILFFYLAVAHYLRIAGLLPNLYSALYGVICRAGSDQCRHCHRTSHARVQERASTRTCMGDLVYRCCYWIEPNRHRIGHTQRLPFLSCCHACYLATNFRTDGDTIFGEFFRINTTPDQLILPIHDLVTVPYAIFLAGRSLPTQGINLRHSYRQLKPGLSDSEKKETLGVLEREGLWTDESLQTWIDTKYDTIVFQVDPRDRESDLEQRIAERFDRTASLGFRGWNIHLYKRKSNGNDQLTIESGQ